MRIRQLRRSTRNSLKCLLGRNRINSSILTILREVDSKFITNSWNRETQRKRVLEPPGPRGGFAEISLPQLQAGSSIMPNKVNPVITEMVSQISFQVICCDQAITLAAFSGQLELNAFLPLITFNLLWELKLLNTCLTLFRTRCVEDTSQSGTVHSLARRKSMPCNIPCPLYRV